jgi:uncharacterized membrane-anchored protein
MIEITKMQGGLLAIGILAILQGIAWVCNKDGAITATTFGLIGLIAGSIFGFTIAKKE